MRDYFKPKTWLITTSIFVIAFSLSLAVAYYEFGLGKNIKVTNASASNNTSGWAWNPNIGWISFNCTDVINSCSGGTNSGKACPNGNECTGGGSCVNTCDLLSNYGVSIDLNTGDFSGYAWSPGVGWISFNRGDTGNPPADPYKDGVGAIAKYNSGGNGKVEGWARILSFKPLIDNGNGWIKLGNEPDYGVAISPVTGNFSGWAWNANLEDGSGIGWISFNCADVPKSCKGGTNPGAPCPNGNECLSGGICVDTCTALSNYKVAANINRPPTVAGMTAPIWSYNDAGQYGALNAILGWTFSDQDAGSSELAYQIIVNTQNSTSSPIFDSGSCATRNTPKCQVDASAVQFQLHSGSDPAMSLNYNTAYYWWIKVWDNKGAESAWTQFNTNISGHALTDNQAGNTAKNPNNPNLTFTTYKHEMPDVKFTWSPFSPSKGEEAKFTDASKVYLNGVPESCDNNSCQWAWSEATANAEIISPTASSTVIKFNSAGNTKVTLTVTDSDGYSISLSKDVNVNAKLPGWKEVKPE